jgi:hypothetical protein
MLFLRSVARDTAAARIVRRLGAGKEIALAVVMLRKLARSAERMGLRGARNGGRL